MTGQNYLMEGINQKPRATAIHRITHTIMEMNSDITTISITDLIMVMAFMGTDMAIPHITEDYTLLSVS